MDYTTSLVDGSKSSSFRVNTRYKILTPSGFQPFDGIRRQHKPVYAITLANGQSLRATANHKILTDTGWRSIEDCAPGTIAITQDDTRTTIIAIEPHLNDWVYDPINVGNGFAYNSGDLISHNCSFLSTAYTLIRPQVLQALEYAKPIAETEQGYREYVAPNPEHVYVMTIDTAAGQGLDSSTFVITDVSTLPYQVVATYENNRITTMEFPLLIMEYAKRYHMPWLLVEVMDIGRDVAFILFRDYEYPKFMSTMNEKRLGQRLIFNNRMNRHLGLRMTAGIKRSGCAVLKTLVENNQLIINDYRIIQQLSVFVQRGAVYTAEVGHHDDMVMPLVMLSWASLQPNFGEITTTRALDTYTKLAKETAENPVTVTVREETPMPLGVFNWGTEDDDSSWLIS